MKAMLKDKKVNIAFTYSGDVFTTLYFILNLGTDPIS
jgi:hypothetical protein